MSRTPLFTRVRQALRLAARLEQAGISTPEGLERMEEARWSRRRFLKAAAMTTAGVTMGAIFPRPPTFGFSMPRVVIVGAGCAGLTCAYRLLQAGIAVRVFEADGRAGGRLFSLRGAFPAGQLAEVGGEFIDSHHAFLHALVRELGLPLTDLHQADGNLSGSFLYFEHRLVPFGEMVHAFRPVSALIRNDLATISGDGTVTYWQPNHAQPLDYLSLAAWLDTRGVTGMLRSLLEVAYSGEFGLDAAEQSCLNMLLTIGTTPGTLDFVPESDQRYRIADGNDNLTTRLANLCMPSIQLNTRLEAIRQNAAGSYILTLNREGAVWEIQADEVVLAIPFTLLREVDIQVALPPAKRLAIDTLGYGTNAKVMAGFASRVWQVAGSNGLTLTDLPYQVSWDATLGQTGSHGVLTSFVGGSRGVHVGVGSPEFHGANFVSQIDGLFPGVAAAYTGQTFRAPWVEVPWIRGSYACYRPGQYTTIRGAEMEAVGGLHFAGEHTSLASQGFMNGAVESGERAAAEVLARLVGD